jgi:DNA-binding transcriptional LysR family regulator
MHLRMNWESVGFDWNQARAFLATALEGSLSAAARKLRQTQPTLSRQVAALERSLSATLFERVGKRLVLTETGLGLLEHVRAMGEAAGRVSLGASGRSQAIVGQVRISASEVVAAYLLPPIVERLRELHPEIDVHVVASNRLSDLLRREADIAIRHVRPEQPDLVARKVRESSAHLYASTSYLKRHGRPTARRLEHVVFVGADDNPRLIEALAGIGARVRLDQFKWTTDSHLVGWEMVRRGLGIGVMVREIAEDTPDIEQVLRSLRPIPVPYWLCTHRELATSRRIRVAFDVLADGFRGKTTHEALPIRAVPKRRARA